jgi:hypothetical protein
MDDSRSVPLSRRYGSGTLGQEHSKDIKSLAMNVLQRRKPVPRLVEADSCTAGDGTKATECRGHWIERLNPTIHAELDGSRKRLEALDCALRIESGWGGTVWLVANDHSKQHVDGPGVVYSARDAFFLVQLKDEEVRKLHSFRKRYGGRLEWTATPK